MQKNETKVHFHNPVSEGMMQQQEIIYWCMWMLMSHYTVMDACLILVEYCSNRGD
jgi:hypothetical protein